MLTRIVADWNPLRRCVGNLIFQRGAGRVNDFETVAFCV